MSSGQSESSTSSTTQNLSEDNRVVADGGSIALAKDAVYNYMVENELSPGMVTALKEFVSLVRDAGEVVINTTDKANQQSQNTISAFTSAIQNDKQGTTTTEQAIVKMLPLVIIGAIIIIIFMMIRKKG